MNEHSSFTEKQRAELGQIIASEVKKAMDAYFADTGRTLKGFLISLAVIIGSLTVVFGGLKAMLAWLGYTYVSMKP